MQVHSGKRDRKYERGQVLIMLAVVMIGLMLSASLAIDITFAYVTKARLQKAVDAASLVAMQDLNLEGQTAATATAASTFTSNYPTTGLDASAPAVTVTFSTTSGQQVVTVNATATIRTIFLGLLPGHQSYNVAATAQALRGYLAMPIVLDRSGSMSSNNGGTALQSAVPTFLTYFNNSTDKVGMVSFASNATTDVAIATSFQSPINTAVANMTFSGATFGPGGLTLSKAQADSVIPTQGENLIKVVVYFTDGLVNTIQSTLSCNGVQTVYNLGGYDSGSDVGFFNPTTGVQIYMYDGSSRWYTCNNGDCSTQTSSSCLRNDAGFTSQIDGKVKSFTRTNVTADAQYQALQTAAAMQAEGIYIYSIGLGSSPDQTFLQKIANDPASPTYNSSLPIGEAVFAPSCPSSSCTNQLQQVFQTIAAKILLRLTQ